MASNPQSEKLLELAGENVASLGPQVDDDSGPFVCTGALLVSEWMDGEGREWFTFTSTEARGEHMATWRIRGLIHEVEAGLTARTIIRTLEPDDDDDE